MALASRFPQLQLISIVLRQETTRRPQPPGVTKKIGEVILGNGGKSDKDPRVVNIVVGDVESGRVCLQTQGSVGFLHPDHD
jgi:hypothetical protein